MINTLPSPKSTRKSKQLGRGVGTGTGGHTVGRGLKGATARSGYKYPRRGFEGGQNPISRRLPQLRGTPKKGHSYTTNRSMIVRKEQAPVKLSLVAEKAAEMKLEEVTIASLVEMGLIDLKFSKKVLPKILLDKAIESKLVIKGIKTSKSAKAAIEKAGGSVE